MSVSRCTQHEARSIHLICSLPVVGGQIYRLELMTLPSVFYCLAALLVDQFQGTKCTYCCLLEFFRLAFLGDSLLYLLTRAHSLPIAHHCAWPFSSLQLLIE